MWPTVNKQLWRLSVHKFCNNKYTNVIVSKTKKNTTEQLKCRTPSQSKSINSERIVKENRIHTLKTDKSLKYCKMYKQ